MPANSLLLHKIFQFVKIPTQQVGVCQQHQAGNEWHAGEMQGYGDKKDVQDDGKIDRRAGYEVGIRFYRWE